MSNIRQFFCRRRKGIRPRRLIVEQLENRALLAAVITVNSALDTDARDTVLTLREAIKVSNRTLTVASLTAQEKLQVVGTPALGNTDTIGFNIPGTGVQSIFVGSDLPALTDPAIIDGYTQPGAVKNSSATDWNGKLMIELSGGQMSSRVGLTLNGFSTIRGLIINQFHNEAQFDGVGILMQNAGGNTIEGNLIGTDYSGHDRRGNDTGIFIPFDSTGNKIGGTTPAARNVISGNIGNGIWITGGNKNQIQGNLIGTDVTGTQAVANGGSGVAIFNGNATNGPNTVGGEAAGARNIISGNYGFGVYLQSGGGAVVQGNVIGTDLTGKLNLANDSGVVVDQTSSNNLIGGLTAAAGNVIAFNTFTGVDLRDGTGNSVRRNSIYSNGWGFNLSFQHPTPNDPGDFDIGPNNLQNYPEISSVTLTLQQSLTIQYSVPSSITNSAYPLAIEFFKADASGLQGQEFLGTDLYVLSDTENTVTFTALAALTGKDKIVATATDINGNTSEFSVPAAIPPPNCSTVVSNTNDSGNGSLRQAIACANVRSVGDTIGFNIPGTGVQTIAPTSPLPAITAPVTIDGYTQPGASPNSNGPGLGDNAVLRIELVGSNVGGTDPANGLTINSDGCTIRGLAIRDFEAAIAIADRSLNVIQGNFLGTDAAGLTAGATSHTGVSLSAHSTNNQIGGLTPAARNVISGNHNAGVRIAGDGNQVVGNLIGVDVSGTKSFNTKAISGILIVGGSNNFVGGTTAAERNIISANETGVSITGSLDGTTAYSNFVLGNFIGTDVTGKVAAGNSLGGIELNGSSYYNTVGGTTAGAGNLISGNDGFGISVGRTFGECADSFCYGGNHSIQGNYIGTDVTGLLNLGNGEDGVDLDSFSFTSLVGGVSQGIELLGTDAFTGNLISANKGDGIRISTGSSVIWGNAIGTSRTGGSLGNAGNGIAEIDSYGSTIGGAPDFLWPTNAGGNGHYYAFTPFAKDWFQTEFDAIFGGGHLVSINSQAEQDFLVNTVLTGAAANQTFWIGATDELEEGVFKWTSGEPFTYSNWNAGQPDNFNGEAYAAINWDHAHQGGVLGTWNDLPQEGRAGDGSAESYFGIVEFDGRMGNVIAFNGQNGISVSTINSFGTSTVLSNSIFSNGGLGIDLGGDGVTGNDLTPTPDADFGINNLQNFPAISNAVPSSGKLKVTYTVPTATDNANYPIHVEFFKADASGQEGQTYLGADLFTEADFAAGGKTLTFNAVATIAGGDKLVATAADSYLSGGQPANTSEFSPGIAITSPWRNPDLTRRWDVNDDTHVVADDVIAIINYINAKGSGKVPDGAANVKPFCDTNGDNNVAADDVLDVINYINAGFGGEAEGEQGTVQQGAWDGGQGLGDSDLIALLAMDVSQSPRKRK